MYDFGWTMNLLPNFVRTQSPIYQESVKLRHTYFENPFVLFSQSIHIYCQSRDEVGHDELAKGGKGTKYNFWHEERERGEGI
jgi:hypothetical protein